MSSFWLPLKSSSLRSVFMIYFASRLARYAILQSLSWQAYFSSQRSFFWHLELSSRLPACLVHFGLSTDVGHSRPLKKQLYQRKITKNLPWDPICMPQAAQPTRAARPTPPRPVAGNEGKAPPATWGLTWEWGWTHISTLLKTQRKSFWPASSTEAQILGLIS